jgi:1-aminocyclopropane-1-carboxylate deaminase/D-cysteine desulfhydrase-like pyridoxal-dependent ACC family enzyme
MTGRAAASSAAITGVAQAAAPAHAAGQDAGAGSAAVTTGTSRPGAGPQPAASPWPGITLPGRVPLAVLPTPLLPAPRLASALGAGTLLIKRDDLTGFCHAGNKARPLEFLLAAALSEDADTLVTGGAPGSNFCAAAAAAAQRAGLGCRLVIAGQPAPPGPALALALAWGATVSWTGSSDRGSVDAGLTGAAADLAAAGHRPYLIPRGGATAIGAVGFALAAAELAGQLAGRGAGRARVVVPVGSGGTLAGLVAGNVLLGRPLALAGGSASRPPGEAAARVLALARDCLRLLAPNGAGAPDGPDAPQSAAGAGPARKVTEADVIVSDVRGPGHGLPSEPGTAAARLAMRPEGLLADPGYTAKALPLAAAAPQAGGPQPDAAGRAPAPPPEAAGDGAAPVVFWHTGGLLDVVAAAEAGQ